MLLPFHSQLPTLTSYRVRCLFWFGPDAIGIQKMRSVFFERAKNSTVPVMQPAGCGGKNHKLFKSINQLIQHPIKIKSFAYFQLPFLLATSPKYSPKADAHSSKAPPYTKPHPHP